MKMLGQYVPDNANLALVSRGIKTGSAARRELRRSVSQSAGDYAGRGGIADAHLADGYKALASSGSFRREFGSNAERLCHLLIGHCCFLQHVTRAVRDLVMMQAGDSLEIRVNPYVYDVELDTMKAREHIDRCSLSEKVENHLMSYFARICTHTFGSNA